MQDFAYVTLQAPDGLAGSGDSGSEQAVDLLIGDIGLPGLNERGLADAVRLKDPGLPVLLMTGYAENTALAGGFLEQGVQLVTKPSTLAQSAGRIRMMLEHCETQNGRGVLRTPRRPFYQA